MAKNAAAKYKLTALVELQQLGLSEFIVKTKIVVFGELAMLALSQASLASEFVKDPDRSLAAMLQDGR